MKCPARTAAEVSATADWRLGAAGGEEIGSRQSMREISSSRAPEIKRE